MAKIVCKAQERDLRAAGNDAEWVGHTTRMGRAAIVIIERYIN